MKTEYKIPALGRLSSRGKNSLLFDNVKEYRSLNAN